MKPEDVHRVRELTNASLSACKRALAVSGNDVNRAVELLRKEFPLLDEEEPVTERKRVC